MIIRVIPVSSGEDESQRGEVVRLNKTSGLATDLIRGSRTIPAKFELIITKHVKQSRFAIAA